MAELHGIFAAAVTPFDAASRFDAAWQRAHFRWLHEHGIEGVLVAGTNGEGPSLSYDERCAVIEAAAQNRGALQLIAGTGTPSLNETIALSRFALEAGADAVLVVPPYYFRDAPSSGLIAYYRALFDALPSNGRALLYHIPRVSGVPVSHELLAALRESHPRNCYGIKDTGGDAGETAKFVQAFPALQVLGGSDHLVADNLKAGVRGQISGLANAVPELLSGLFRAYRAGEAVDGWQARIKNVQSVVKKYPQHGAIKTIASFRAELEPIYVKPPLLNLAADQAAALQREFEALPAHD